MILTLNLKIDNATASDVKAFTFLLRHMAHGEDAVAQLMRKGQFNLEAATPGLDAEGRQSFKTGRTVSVKATKQGR